MILTLVKSTLLLKHLTPFSRRIITLSVLQKIIIYKIFFIHNLED